MLTHSPRHSPESGFTLIEIMIVLAIVAATLAFGSSKMFNSSASMRSSIRKFAILTREVRNVARLTNSTYRIVLQMNPEKGSSYWIESAPGNAVLLTNAQQKDIDSMTELQKEEDAPKEQFSKDTRVQKSPEPLPRGLKIESVEYAKKKDPVVSGKAYIYFFPSGLSDDAAIHLTDKKTLNWTITIHPLTGRATVFERKASLKELRP